MGKGEQRSLNPVDSFRREIKRKEIKKAKLAKELHKKQDEEEKEKYDAFLAEYNRLTDEASKRSLSAIEKSKRKELKQYLDSNSKYSNEDAASKRRKLGHQLPSGLYDPLSEEHQMMYERAHRPPPLTTPPPPCPVPTSRDTVTAPPLPASSTEPAPALEELPDDFFPDLPNEPVPRTHRAKQGPLETVVMAGYPPPPAGALPTYPPHMASPITSSSSPPPRRAAPKPAVVTTISALPQIRDLKKETLAFVPSKVPVAPKKKVVRVVAATAGAADGEGSGTRSGGKSEKDMYDQFLQEMEGLL